MMARISYLVYAAGGGVGEGRRELFREYMRTPGAELLFWMDGTFDPGVTGAGLLSGNAGVLEAMGRMLSESRGEYVVFMDLDSLIFPWMAATLAGRLDESPFLGGAYGLQYGYGADCGEVVFVRGGPLSYFRLFERCPLGGGCAVLRRSAIEAAGGIRPFRAGQEPGWDQFLYSRMALKSPWHFEPLPVGACLSGERRFQPFHAGKDSINTLVSLVNDMVSRNCRVWFREEYGGVIDALCSGSIKAGDWELPVLLAAMGVIYAAEGIGKSDAEGVLSAAERLGTGDWGVGMSRAELCLSGHDYVSAWKCLEALHKDFGEDSYILRKVLELKRRVMEKTGAPLETRREFDGMMREFVDDAYYIRGEERRKIGKWLGRVFKAEDGNNV